MHLILMKLNLSVYFVPYAFGMMHKNMLIHSVVSDSLQPYGL